MAAVKIVYRAHAIELPGVCALKNYRTLVFLQDDVSIKKYPKIVRQQLQFPRLHILGAR